jgi:PAS domain S-box-containing protein
LRTTLKDGSANALEIFSEYVGNTRAGTDYEKEFIALVKRKYEGKKFDLIFTVGQFPTRILLRNRAELFPGTPIVFLAIDQRIVADLYPGPDLTGVWGEISFKPNLELALALHPGTKRVVMIQGVSEDDKDWATRAQEDFRAYQSSLEFTKLSGLTTAEMRMALGGLPPNTIVFFVSSIRDNSGNTYESPDYLRQVSPVSSAPIYGTTEAHLGSGIVGGRLLSFEALGVEGAKMGLRVLAGEKPETITPHAVPSVTMFDWRELKRWGISENSLPAGSIVSFKQLTFWERYKWYVIAVSAVMTLQMALIAWLLVMRVRRRQAERENERLARIADAEHRQLNEVVSNVPGIVWQASAEPGSNDRKTTFISNYVEKMLGYTAAEWLSAPSGFGLTLMPDAEDRQESVRASDAVLSSGKEGFVRFRWLTKDGRTLWVESYLTAIFDDDGKVVGLRGVSLDVSERILAEESQRRSEQRSQAIVHAIPDQIFLLTPEGTYFDYQVTDVKGPFVPPEEFIGRNIRDVLPPNVAENLFQCLQRARENSEPQILEYQIRIGKVDRWFEARIVSMGDNILYVMRDISERKEAEEALRLSNEELSQLKNQLEEENIYLREEISLEQNFGEMVGESAELRYVLFKIAEVGPTESTVLITGETGTGKELVARAIHNASNRRDRPLVKVNCAALSPSLIESEFFGHEKGAFTGASARKIGRFELANGATIFLDEIGELPTELQVKLLRVIQEGELERLGSSDTIKVDVRIIAATNRNLDQEVKRGMFREDLWYRLNVFPVTVPPLRQRRDDIPILVRHFASRFAKKLGRTITAISPATLKSLRDYSWPGNVRELANVIERAVISSRGSTLRIGEDFTEAGTENLLQASKTLKEFEREYILHILHETGWRIEGRRGTARILGINPSTLRARIVKLGIQKPT